MSDDCCVKGKVFSVFCFVFFFQAEDGIRDLVRSRGLGDVYKRQHLVGTAFPLPIGKMVDPCLLMRTDAFIS